MTCHGRSPEQLTGETSRNQADGNYFKRTMEDMFSDLWMPSSKCSRDPFSDLKGNVMYKPIFAWVLPGIAPTAQGFFPGLWEGLHDRFCELFLGVPGLSACYPRLFPQYREKNSLKKQRWHGTAQPRPLKPGLADCMDHMLFVLRILAALKRCRSSLMWHTQW